ncbi:hypothetical protein C8J56DRAFT_1030733 [Mycena floridula]|nr:hypothetical protein C8J56DRAFT_1030733 [Mycena floridula]
MHAQQGALVVSEASSACGLRQGGHNHRNLCHSLKLLRSSFSPAHMAWWRHEIFSHPTTAKLARRLHRIQAPTVWQIGPTIPFEEKYIVPRRMDQAQGHERWTPLRLEVYIELKTKVKPNADSIDNPLSSTKPRGNPPIDLVKSTWFTVVLVAGGSRGHSVEKNFGDALVRMVIVSRMERQRCSRLSGSKCNAEEEGLLFAGSNGQEDVAVFGQGLECEPLAFSVLLPLLAPSLAAHPTLNSPSYNRTPRLQAHPPRSLAQTDVFER